MSKEKYIPEIIENTEVFDTNPPMYGKTYKCPHCRELVEVKDILALNYSYQEIGIKIERLFKEALK